MIPAKKWGKCLQDKTYFFRFQCNGKIFVFHIPNRRLRLLGYFKFSCQKHSSTMFIPEDFLNCFFFVQMNFRNRACLLPFLSFTWYCTRFISVSASFKLYWCISYFFFYTTLLEEETMILTEHIPANFSEEKQILLAKWKTAKNYAR